MKTMIFAWHSVLIGFLCFSLTGLGAASAPKTARSPKHADESKPPVRKADPSQPKKVKTIAEVTAGHKKYPGLFTLYQDTTNGAVHLVIGKNQIDGEYIYFTHTTDGVTAAGHFRGNFRDNTVFSIRKHFNRIEFVTENTGFYFNRSNALSRASSANISPAVLAVQEIVAEDKEKGEYLIKADGIFLSENFHQVKPSPDPNAKPGQNFALGTLSKEKTKFWKLKNYPLNTDVIVEYVYDNPAPWVGGGAEVTDPRNVSIRLQHSMIEMPKNSYQPRLDDPRVGYFMQQVTDLTSTRATPYRDLINRWHLEKKDKGAPLSEPVEPIVWWIENTTPTELRETIRDAALAWNEAFESAGFRNAVVVKVQPDDADWDAGDIRYNVLRWTSSPTPPFGGYGPSFVNPRTGQILGADIMLEFVFIANQLRNEKLFETTGFNFELESGNPARGYCSLGDHLHRSSLFGASALRIGGAEPINVDEYIKSSLYFLVLHEIGHTLGLNHNMKSSQLHSPAEIHNKGLTEKVGLYGSVMDYPSVNFAAPGQKQGQYWTTKPGPYDKWAIEFGYSPAAEESAAESARLEKILARSTERELLFGNDADDMRSPGKAIDPRVMINDMSNDAIGYAIDRFKLVRDVLSRLQSKYATPGQSYHELRNAYLVLTAEYSTAATVISRYLGGVYLDRAVAGQPGAQKPFVPVAAADQKRALAALRTYVFAPAAFGATNGVYHYLQMQRRGFEFFSTTEDPKIHDRILNLHRGLLDHLLHPRVLARITDTRLYGNEYPLGEFLEELTASIFAEDLGGDVNSFRQNLQLEYVNRLAGMISETGKNRYDYASQSQALQKLKNLQKQLTAKVAGNSETQAHTGHMLFLIENALDPRKTKA
jgi:hypothetical protein